MAHTAICAAGDWIVRAEDGEELVTRLMRDCGGARSAPKNRPTYRRRRSLLSSRALRSQVTAGVFAGRDN